MSLSDPGCSGFCRIELPVLFALVVFVAAPVHADEPDERPEDGEAALEDAPDPFNGAFGEWSGRFGPVLPSTDGDAGWIADVGFRNSLPMYLGDHRIAYQYSRLPAGDGHVGVHGLHATLALHPLYLALLSRGLISHVLASLHLELGVGPRWARPPGENADDQWGVAGSVGTGFDLPLTRPNQGRSLWINAVYRHTWSTIDLEAPDRSLPVGGHQFFVGLAWRTNGIVW